MKFLDSFIDGEFFCIVTEYCEVTFLLSKVHNYLHSILLCFTVILYNLYILAYIAAGCVTKSLVKSVCATTPKSLF